ncbi:hypothetical protein E4U02_14455 [Microbacterium paludicola]|uniref:Uncharacterized protein n=1 Tax=Microbacterium paludicola TaxID=300019 RepID=A0A4Y9FPZ2_9MICO|nr:hypothetical protein [Microbacterium paludicola]MBF0817605.1 hypothetical protein [Microbacterium paludicola]TFU30583.1 hypothetical protein E4U02_14455 [Microbacterium paludicola]
MPAIESRPYRVPPARAVAVNVRLLDPEVAFEDLPDVWEPGRDLTVGITASLTPDFWEVAGIGTDEDLSLVASITCLAARTKWRESVPFTAENGVWGASVAVVVDGSAVAVEALIDVAVVGPGRTGHPDAARGVHRAARLWNLPAPPKLLFERLGNDFPTSAVSFEHTMRLRLPWAIETAHEADPTWGVTSAIRLYVNTDFAAAERILDGTAEPMVYESIQADIYVSVLHQLAGWRTSYTSAAMNEIVQEEPTSLVALGANVASALGLDLELALRLASEEPSRLLDRAREAAGFMSEHRE